jgi:hypothetical protein
MLTAFALVPSGAHLAALPNKMAMSQAAAQQSYAGTAVALQYQQGFDFVRCEQPKPPIFITDTQLSLVTAVHTVGDDDDLALRQNLVESAVDDVGDRHDRTQFFGELTNKAGFRGFAGFEATAR